VVTDLTGGVYLTGITHASQFPKIYGPYGFEIGGTQDAFITKLQGDVYSHDYAAYFGGNLADSGDYLQIDPNGNIWVAGNTTSTDFPGNTNPNVQVLHGDASATGGTFTLTYTNGVSSTSNAFAYNASAATI